MKTTMMRGGVAAMVMLASAVAWAGDGSDDAKALRDWSSGDLQPTAPARGDTTVPGPSGEARASAMRPGEGDTGRGASGGGGERAKETDVPKSMSAEPASPEKVFLHVWPEP